MIGFSRSEGVLPIFECNKTKQKRKIGVFEDKVFTTPFFVAIEITARVQELLVTNVTTTLNIKKGITLDIYKQSKISVKTNDTKRPVVVVNCTKSNILPDN